MGLMDDAMRADAEYSADTDQMAEACSYSINGGATVTVRAVINRIDAQPDLSVSDIATREFEIWIPYSSDYGLTSKPAPGDTISVKDDYSDGSSVVKSLDRILETDAAGWLCRFV